MSSYTGFVANRSHHVVNCKHDTRGVAEDVRFSMNGSQFINKDRRYGPPTLNKDRSIKAGEVLFTYRKNRLGPDQQPSVRSVLNGALFARNNKSHEDQIRIVGVSAKDVEYDAGHYDLDPSDDPVAVVSGTITAVNTGSHKIQAGDAVQAYLPPPGGPPQYQDGASRFSDDRKVFAYRPLVLPRTMYEEIEQSGLLPELSKLDPSIQSRIKEPRFNDLLETIRAQAYYEMRNVVGVATTEGLKGKRFDLMVNPMLNLKDRSRASLE